MKKINRALAALLLFSVSQQAMATKFTVVSGLTNPDISIMVSPRWTGSKLEFVPVTLRVPVEQDSGNHHLKYILWRYGANRQCWSANLEKELGGLLGRFRQNVTIKIYEDGWYTINLNKKVVKDENGGTVIEGEGMKQKADPSNC